MSIRDPRRIAPPVQLLSRLAPVDHPQHMPPSPHRLPPPSARPVRRVTDNLLFPQLPPEVLVDVGLESPLQQLPPGAVPSSQPTPMPPGAQSAKTFEPHRYARFIEGIYTAPAASSGQPFLVAFARRNFLGFRNTQAAGGDNIYVGFGRAASAQSWLVLEPTEIVVFDTVVDQSDLYAISDTGAGVLAYVFSTFAME